MRRDDAWRLIRGTRSAPPGEASRSDRRKVYCAALEQAEQLFRAAQDLGHAARPIDLFYGLSQAGRAITAALVAQGSEWRLKGHGITSKGGLDQPVDKFMLMDEGRRNQAFTTVAKTLGPTSLPTPVSLATLLAALPVPTYAASWNQLPGPLTLRYSPMGGTYPHVGVHVMTQGWRPNVLRGVRGLDDSRRAVAEELAHHYPKLQDAWPFPNDVLDVKVTAGGAGLRVELPWPSPPSGNKIDAVKARGTPRAAHADGSCQLYPTFTGYRSEHPPLVIWWAVLWALSMLARYEPQRWTDLLAVDISRDATALEHVLDTALDAVPVLLVRILAQPPPP